MREFDPELVTGSIARSVWKLAWPVVMLQLVSGIHGFLDQVLVGRYVGFEANAGIGAAWQLYLLVVVFVVSLFHGMGVLVARYSGRRDHKAVSRVVYNTFLASFYLLTLVLAPIGYLISPMLLRWINASPEVTVHALPYLRALFLGSTPMFLLWMVNGSFQTSGDPRTPLKLGVLTTVVHILISYLLITGPGPFPQLGSLGAAIGSVVGPIPSLIVAVFLILRGKAIVRPPEKFPLLPDLSVIKVVLRIGIPSGIQAVLLNVGGVFLLRYVGSLEQSAAAMAAYAICYSQLFSFVTFVGFGLRSASATIMGQNLGAEKPQRAKRGVYIAAGLAFLWASAFAALYWTIPETLLGLFKANEGEVLAIGVELLRYLAFTAFFAGTTFAFTGGLQGAGDTKKPMYIAFLSQIVVLIGMCALFDRFGTLTSGDIWLAIFVSHVLRFVLTVAVFRSGKWMDITVELDDWSGAELPGSGDEAVPESDLAC